MASKTISKKRKRSVSFEEIQLESYYSDQDYVSESDSSACHPSQADYSSEGDDITSESDRGSLMDVDGNADLIIILLATFHWGSGA